MRGEENAAEKIGKASRIARSVRSVLGMRSLGKTRLAWVAQLVERVLGKDEVTGSIPVPGSRDGVGFHRAGVTQR